MDSLGSLPTAGLADVFRTLDPNDLPRRPSGKGYNSPRPRMSRTNSPDSADIFRTLDPNDLPRRPSVDGYNSPRPWMSRTNSPDSADIFRTLDPNDLPRRPSGDGYNSPRSRMSRTNSPDSAPLLPRYHRRDSADRYQRSSNPNPNPGPPPQPARNRCCNWWRNWREALNLLAGVAIFVLVACLVASVPVGLVFYCYCRAGGSFAFAEPPVFTVSSLRLAALSVDSMDQLTSMLRINLTAHNPNSFDTFNYDKAAVAASSGGVPIGDAWLPEFKQSPDHTAALSATATEVALQLNGTDASDLANSSTIPLEIDLKMKARITSLLVNTVKVEMEVRCGGIEVAVPKGKVIPPASFPNAPCEVKFRLNIVVDMLKQVLDLILDIISKITKKKKKKKVDLVSM